MVITRSRLAEKKFCPVLQESRQCYKLFINDILFCNARILLYWYEIIPCNRFIPSKRDEKLEKSSFKKSIETYFNRSKMFLFFTTHIMSVCENRKVKTSLDFFKSTEIYRSSRSQMFFKIGAPKTFTTFTGKPALKPLFNKITPKQVFSVNIAKFLRLVFCNDEFW